MSAGQGEYEQPVDEVLQLEETAPVRVEVVNTVATKALPGLAGDTVSATLNAVRDTENLAGGDPRRSRAVIWANQPVYVATSREAVLGPTAALLGANQQLVILHRDPVWVRATVVNTVASASVERWAD